MSTEREILERIDRRSERDSERIEDISEEMGATVKALAAMQAEQDHLKNQVDRISQSHLQSAEIMGAVSTRITSLDIRMTNVEDSNRMHRKEFEEARKKRIEDLELKQRQIEEAEAEAKKWKIRTAIGVLLTLLTAAAGWLWDLWRGLQ